MLPPRGARAPKGEGRPLHTRRALAAMLGSGLAAPGLARALPHPLQSGQDDLSIVAAVKPHEYNPNETIETSADPYRRMTAPITINGKGPYFFVVDTGANQSVISRELATEIGLTPGEAVNLHGVAGVELTPTVTADRMQLGGRLQRDVKLPTLPQAAIGAQGILGIDYLKDKRINLDFRSHQLNIEQSQFEDVPPFTSRVKAKQRSGQLTIVDADLAGIPVSAFLDSGAERTIGNPALYELAVLKVQQGAFYDVPIISVTGRTIAGRIALLPLLRLGHVKLVDISVTFADLHVFQIWGLEKPAILVGMDALSTFDSVTLDFGRAEVLFELNPRNRSSHRR